MVTALPLQQGLMNLTAGTFFGITIAHCEVAGEIGIMWPDGTIENYAMVPGQDAFTYGAKTVKVDSGEFTFARA